MSQVWDDASISKQPELLVMLALADFCNDSGEAWPSIDSIALKARMSDRGVQRIIIRLTKSGKVSVRRGGGLPGTTNLYRLTPRVTVGHLSTERGDRRGNGGVTLEAERGDRRVHSGSPDPSVPVIDPSVQPSELFKDSELMTEECRVAWDDWNKYRRERRQKITPSTARLQLKLLKEWGPKRWVDAINNSIEKGYQGIFEQKLNGNGSGFAPSPAVQLKSVSEVISTHPANRDSTAYNPRCTEAQRAELKALRLRADDLNRQIALAGVSA